MKLAESITTAWESACLRRRIYYSPIGRYWGYSYGMAWRCMGGDGLSSVLCREWRKRI